MNIKKGDKVVMLTGKDRRKEGKVLLVRRSSSEYETTKVVVEGLNMIKRHQRARRQGQKGQIISKEQAVDISNVQILCPKCGKATRVGHQILEGTKIRICKKCQAEL